MTWLGRLLVAVALLAAGVHGAEAQLVPATAQVTRIVGQVEIRAGRTPGAPWTPATVGIRLAEQDEIRALGGASAELRLPDGSTLILAENSRFVVSRLRVDPQNQGRSAVFHLATGKLRAIVSQAALRLVSLRQSTFAISTPVAVAAVRGTDLVVISTNPPIMAVRHGNACCIATATGIGLPFDDGQVTDGGSGFICSLPKPMTAQEQQFFYATLNPGGQLQPMMNQPVTVVDPLLIESWGCDEPAARGQDPLSPRGLHERVEFGSPSSLQQLPRR